MSTYKAPLNDMRFVLYDVLGAEQEFARLGQTDATRDVLDAVFDEAARFTETVLAPLNEIGDRVGCRFDKDTGAVTTPPGFKQAYAQFVDGGWTGLVSPVEFGGQGLPYTAGVPLKEMIDAANLAWGNFPLLSHGATDALLHHGEAWQQEVFLKPLVDGRWTGTMCLTEPHCGTDLGLLKTKAEPQADGSYLITGTKIFITAGEHDLTDNIIHLVLARLPDAPAGSKGISLFLVPKFKVARDGTVGGANAVRCGSIEHKMGIHGSATCVLNFDGAQGYLVGQPHKGLAGMFTMMNTARLGVGVQGLGLSDRAWQNALRYSRERLQSRSLSGAKVPGQAGGSDHRPARRAAHAAHLQGAGRRRPRIELPRRTAGRCFRTRADAGGTRAGRCAGRIPHADRESLPDRVEHRMHLPGAAMLRRPWLHCRARHGTARARCPHHHFVRRHHRHPGAGPARPQDHATAGRGPEDLPRHDHAVLRCAVRQ
jgi:alkylation response protein AidB-like acyl-CoA dehydrogenase